MFAEDFVQKVRKRKPTIKQIKALKYISQGMPTATALRKAGYSNTVARTSTAYLKRPSMQQAINSMSNYLEKYGVNDEKVAKRISEFIDAEKKGLPDQTTRVAGVKIYLDLKHNQKEKDSPFKKREMTITEFVTGEETT